MVPGWVASLARRRPARIAGPAAGVALAVALVGSLGAFMTTAKAQMTSRAVRQVPVDWQVEVQPGASSDAVVTAIRRRPDVRSALPVGFASTSGFEATVGGTTQTTGPGVVLGIPPGYQATFPGEIRYLTGRSDGVLLAQQTAANLHAGPGDTVSIGLPGLPPVPVVVDGVVDLPAADSLFQRVGAPPGAQPQAPPDNVALLPAARWHDIFDRLNGGQVRTQVHVRVDHHLPHDPAAAYTRASGAAHRLEADLAGAAVVGNNLAATLDAARSDALYAEALFLLLGLPGVVLAGLLTRTVAAAFADSRRRELALLRTRGASLGRLQRLAGAEALAVATAGAPGGVVVALVVGRLVFGSSTFGATTFAALAWGAAAVGAGILVTVVAVAAPARRDATAASVAAARRPIGLRPPPLVLRYGLDVVALAGGVAVFWATARNHYNLVLAPEGVPTVSLSWWALAGPFLLWIGSGLLAWRLSGLVLERGRLVRTLVRPLTGRLRGPVAATLRRQRRFLATGVVLITLSTTFAISTAVFDTTYRHQVGVDALLTNGAPVTVTQPPGTAAGAVDVARLSRVPGVRHAEPLLHRFVYVGADLQDLYGVDPSTIGSAGKLQDSYFSGGTASQMLRRLARQPDAALVSAETVREFQLRPGDRLRLRLRDAASGALTPVDFRYAGIVKEFPTAPTDSFVVANASYVARRTGDPKVSTFLVSTGGAPPATVAARLRRLVTPPATVTDIEHARHVVGSSLTAVDLTGLSRIELAYALVLVVTASGLVLGLGLAQRRRALAILAAIGARRSQQSAFTRAEAATLATLGGTFGLVSGTALTYVLVKVLTGVFDPPPVGPAVPWGYLAAVAALAALGLVVAAAVQVRSLRRPVVEIVRDL